MDNTIKIEDRFDKIEECIIHNLMRFNIHEALREYDLTLSDLGDYMSAAAAGFKQRQQVG